MKRALFIALVWISACSGEDRPPGTVIGATSVQLDTRLSCTRTGECAIADYITDTYLATVRAQGKTADALLLNGGAIRGGSFDPVTRAPISPESRIGALYPPGPLTDQEVIGWYPFQDDTVLVTLTGAQLKSALERAASLLPPDIRQDEGGAFLQVSGMQYTIDCSGQPQELTAARDRVLIEGTRVVRIAVAGRVIYDRDAGVDHLTDGTARLVLTSFLTSGKDGHLTFTQGANPDTIPLAQLDVARVLVDAVKAGSPIAPATDGRITVIGGCDRPQ